MTETPSFNVPAFPGTLAEAPCGEPRKPNPGPASGVARRFLPAVTWKLAGTWLHLAYGLQASGREHIPARGSCVFVANHTSHLDVLVLASQLSGRRRQRVVPIAAADHFFSNWFRAGISRNLLNAVPFRRCCGRRHNLASLRDELVRGEWSYLIFPEGTRSRDGGIGEFRAGIGALVSGTPVPVIPCHISGAFGVWPPQRILPRPKGRLSVRFGSPLCFERVPHRRSGWDRVAEEVRAEVRRLAPIPSESAAGAEA